jgi:2,5-furandicarboxylate decarboxylase 1
MSNSGVLDTRFRSALERMAVQGRLQVYAAPIDPYLEVAAVMKKLDGDRRCCSARSTATTCP